MEEHILRSMHRYSSPALDSLFLLSHQLGRARFCTAMVVVMALLWWRQNNRIEVKLWLGLGLSTFVLQWSLKLLFARPRPQLWDTLIQLESYAMPSGHALVATTLYPLLAHSASKRWPQHKVTFYCVATLLALYIGLGRLYLGVHWPSDVLVGWILGFVQLQGALHWARNRRSVA